MKNTLNTLFALFFYSCSLSAQTTGPTQPEAAGFTPVGSSDMVNLYTGDLNYNIPLMVIPGPDGGYPINISYSSNLSMDQTASWVGLGWNLNCGAIQRNLRGTPDDFKGDIIHKEVYIKPSVTFNISLGGIYKELSNERLGFDFSINQNYGLYFNNYSGLGLNAGIGFSGVKEVKSKFGTNGIGWNLGLSLGIQEGFSLSPSLSFSKKTSSEDILFVSGTSKTLALGGRLNSKQGFSDLDMNFERHTFKRNSYIANVLNMMGANINNNESSERTTGISFASSSPLAPIDVKRTTETVSFSTQIDPKKLTLFKTKKPLNITGSITSSYITQPETKAPAFGAMYLANKSGDNAISDFYRENNGAFSKDKMVNPIPVLTYDVFVIQGHGIGGSFRAYQNSIGMLSNSEAKSFNTSVGLGLEFGTGSAQKLGAKVDYAIVNSYSGPWRNKEFYQKNLAKYKFNTKTTSKPLFEPFYFQMIGESTPMNIDDWNAMDNNEPVAFDIRHTWKGYAPKVRALNTHNHQNGQLNIDKYPNRNPRVNSIEYLIKSEVQNINNGYYIVDGNNLSPIDYSKGKDHHLNAISVLKPNGVRYNYDLPAYNDSIKKVTFAIPDKPKFLNNIRLTENPKVIDQVGGRSVFDYEKINNGVGEDEFYSKEVIPSYAHTFFITSILSQDYIDVDGNGPSEDDLGTYTKFNYEKVGGYKWRFPFKGVYYTKGYASNHNDDKVSYQEGIKDLYYVKSIETKTHIAVFETKSSKLTGVNGTPQKELVSVSLFSKADPKYKNKFYLNLPQSDWPTAIQTVHFQQNYHLKPGTPNSTNKFSPALDSLYFTYENSSKGENAKYEFNYGNNYKFEPHQQDRWGTYQLDEGKTLVNENPYVYQDENYAKRDDYASVWLMDTITLPSKGKISIEYEKDDYAYVQDRQAMIYAEILGFSSSNSVLPTGNDRWKLTKDDLYVFFKSPTKLKDDADVSKMLNGMKYVRFRANVNLKRRQEVPYDYVSDYVAGYAELEGLNNGGRISDYVGWIKVRWVKPKKKSPNLFHPIRLAAIQYLRKSRPDLGPQYGDLTSLSPSVFVTRNIASMLNEAGSLITGYYTMAKAKLWAMSVNPNRPSYIRLIAPNQKYGGGARVKEIRMHSHDLNDRIYGQSYSYNLPSGRSSGVAEFEPILGMEVSPFTQPVWYNANNDGHKVIFSNEESFFEEPYAPGLYPSATVGYSRVTVRNLREENNSVTFAQSGINVSEFFTAKDFPTAFKPYGAMLQEYPVKIPIPFIGIQSFNNNGYSMGYAFTLNNAIYGRQKSVATFPYSIAPPTGQPIQKTVYNYKAIKNSKHVLNNEVTAMRKEGVKEQVILGRTVDFYIDEIEANTKSRSFGVNPNVNYQPPAAFLPSWFPSISFSETNTRYLTTTKIIYNNPILESVDQYKDGAKVTTSNLFYDYETGKAIITSVTNEWEKPIYSYNFPAHWSYDEMKGAYQNYKAKIYVKQSGTRPSGDKLYRLIDKNQNNLTQDPKEILHNGDLISTFANGEYYVADIDKFNVQFVLKNRSNISASFVKDSAFVKVSSYKNLQYTKKGKIVSLQDWSNNNLYPLQPASLTQTVKILLKVFNTNNSTYTASVFNNSNNSGVIGSISIPECDLMIDVGYSYDKHSNKLIYNFGNSNQSECYVESNEVIPYAGLDFSKFVFLVNTYDNNNSTVNMIYRHSGHAYDGKLFLFNVKGAWNQCYSCEAREPITVLHADATEFSDEWKLNYKDLEKESTNINQTLTDIANNSSLGNPYAFGMKGIWRPARTSAYLVDRIQSEPQLFGNETRIDVDGEYEEFYCFDWQQPITYNEEYNWRWVNEVTEYNVNGASKEGRNRMNIYSSSLFGYSNHLVTGSASNSKTTDIGFDGFEDYTLNTSNVYIGNGHGNLNFDRYWLYPEGHTGEYSLNLNDGLACPTCYYEFNSDLNGSGEYFTPKEGKYYISYWTKYSDRQNIITDPPPTQVDVVLNNNVLVTLTVDATTTTVDGWYRVAGEFIIPNLPTTGTQQFKIRLFAVEDDDVLIDDIRIQPFNSGMETYIYNPTNYRLVATLSNQNFATFYNYDEEGNMVQTKVETEEGIKTISTNRNNIKR